MALEKIRCHCCGEFLICCEAPVRFYSDPIETHCIMCGMSFMKTLPIRGNAYRLEGSRQLFGIRMEMI